MTGRYSLLETIRQYALDRCRAAGELEQQRDRHLRWAVEFLEARDCVLCDRPVFEAIDAEYANIRAALEWASRPRRRPRPPRGRRLGALLGHRRPSPRRHGI